jgi:hypothetical protein
MILTAKTIEELISKIAAAEAEGCPEQEPEEVKQVDLVDVAIRGRVAKMVLENVDYESNEDLKEALDTVYNFVVA